MCQLIEHPEKMLIVIQQETREYFHVRCFRNIVCKEEKKKEGKKETIFTCT